MSVRGDNTGLGIGSLVFSSESFVFCEGKSDSLLKSRSFVMNDRSETLTVALLEKFAHCHLL